METKDVAYDWLIKDSKKVDNNKMAWFNFRTREYDYILGIPENPKDYISQYPAAQNMYDLLIENLGYTKEEAMLKVLSAQVGE